VRRVYVVCGLRMTLSGISEEAAILRNLIGAVSQSQLDDRLNFVADNTAQIEELRDRAELVALEEGRIKENQRKLEGQRSLVKARQLDVKERAAELEKWRGESTAALAELKKLSADVYDRRIKLRDSIRAIEQEEKKIREREALIRARERK
jgi:hypothetical protein